MSTRSPDPPSPSALVTTPGHASSGLTFTFALLAATLLHVGAILFVSFEPPRTEASGVAESALEILILRDAGRGSASPDAALSRIDRSGASSRNTTFRSLTSTGLPSFPGRCSSGTSLNGRALHGRVD